MLKVNINGVTTLFDVIHLDSGEEPESKCTNTIVVARLGGLTFQYAMPPERAIERLVEDIAYRTSALNVVKAVMIPKMITVVIVHYHERFTIDWDAKSVSARSVEMSLSDDPIRAHLGSAVLQHLGI
jgi:hypothetical protein